MYLQYGNTPLHEAAWKGYSKSVDLLLKNKSNAFIANRVSSYYVIREDNSNKFKSVREGLD